MKRDSRIKEFLSSVLASIVQKSVACFMKSVQM